MAIVDNPALSMRASGTMGAINYTIWRGQHVARARTTLVCPMTTPQEKAQNAVKSASQGWSGTLTESERQVWEETARSRKLINRLGNEYRPTGYLLYMKYSVQAILLGGSLLTAPPLESRSAMPTALSVAANAAPGKVDIDCTFEVGYDQPDVVQIFRAGPFDGEGRKAIAPEYLEVQQVTTPYSWQDTGLSSSKYYWYRVRWGWTDGVKSNNWYFQVLIN